MTTVVFGGTGLLGRAVVRVLADLTIPVVGLGFHRGDGPHASVDVRSDASVAAMLDRLAPDTVVNAVGERRPEYWTTPRLDELNVDAAAGIARACATRATWLIHVSTDYVFDGSAPPYRPESPRHPINAYGASKARAEDAVHEAHPDATILRVPVLYGPVEYADESNLTSLVPLVRSGTPTRIDDWAIRYPTLTTDVGAVVAGMLAHRPDLTGTVAHWSGDEGLTKHAMALRIGAVLGFATAHLTPDPTAVTSRPHDTRLDCGLLEKLGVGHRTPLSEGMRAVLTGDPAV